MRKKHCVQERNTSRVQAGRRPKTLLTPARPPLGVTVITTDGIVFTKVTTSARKYDSYEPPDPDPHTYTHTHTHTHEARGQSQSQRLRTMIREHPP